MNGKCKFCNSWIVLASPPYLNSFETRSGFCLITEYKQAPSLGSRRNFRTAQVKQITVLVLEILVYLQQHSPPVIWRPFS